MTDDLERTDDEIARDEARATERGEALVGNAADEKQVRGAKKKERQRLERLELAWKAVAATEDGRLVFQDLLAFASPFRPPALESALALAFTNGQDDVGRFVMNKLKSADPARFISIVFGDTK